MAYGVSPKRSLRVGLISTCALATPPRTHGETEAIVSELARELRELGHRPTVFATGDSTCAGARGALFSRPVRAPDDLAELRHAGAAWAEIAAAGDFDIVHVHRPEAIPFTRFVAVPTVATVHHDRDPSRSDHYAAYPDVAFVAVSRRQEELAWEVPFRAVVHHGLDAARYPCGRGGRSCVFLGRLSAETGPHLAIEAAR
ncbi:MAG TPA: glycosyltransferase, partial [Labilithrix sp.]|nr:glycosyltransferase [Labilithrix sp.]